LREELRKEGEIRAARKEERLSQEYAVKEW